MYDSGTNEDSAPDWADDERVAGSAKRPSLRLAFQRTFKLYASASRLVIGQSLGQNRWLAAAGLAGALSFGLLGLGLTALVAPYSGVETAALTADDAPQIVAMDADGAAEDADVAAATPAQAAPQQMASAEAPQSTTTAAPDLNGTDTAEATPADEAAPETAHAAPVPAPQQQVAVQTGPQEVHTKIALNDGATLMQVLTDAGADRVDAYHAIAALRPVYSPSKLRSGQEISLTFVTTPAAAKPAASSDVTGSIATAAAPATDAAAPAAPTKLLTAISLQPDVDRQVEVRRGEDGNYTSAEIQRELTTGFARAKGTINSSLFLDAQQAGIPPQIIVEMIRMFSYSIDFQREIHPGDGFEVFFDRKYDNGVAVKEGDIAYASMTVLGKPHRLWRYKMADGSWDYFDEGGNSMKKFLMKTPVDGARITSGFGMRKHPILGFTKFHEGVDFAAPKGTPIYAAGDGVVKIAGWVNGYGNFVELGHANKYETAYGHMSAFAKGIRVGTRVHQGQVIGYVGSTGRSTGPHLHYEIHIAGKKVNPLGVKMATGVKLEGKQLAAFKAVRAKVMTQMAEAPMLTTVAQASDTSKAN
ncbi:MAG: M23 family metallopeptidase [Parvibaculum sp.]|uniref:M23 family metallopeptidase n=1 Tax=Parvibaculum sp. TaxID=2024848 RepID=UPI0028471CCC|nr:M23 family metallopeptidase [Parvibaculum sp.]MDR3497718.1 M23 family metallopeptidase [Parvibaculum sp.]